MEHADLLAKVADEEGLPVNILATIASMESGGNTNIASRDEHGRIIAQGMIQVVARFHMDKIIPVAAQHGHEIADGTAILSRWRAAVSSHSDTHFVDTIPDIVSAMADPEVNVRVGAMILKEFYEKAKEHTQAPDHPVTWVRALSEYNGGGAQAAATYEAMSGESRHYADYAARFFMTAEIATQLRREGYDDNEIQAALHSAETDARAYAYEKYKGKTGVNERSSVDDLNHLWRELAREKLTDPILVKAYTDYKHGVRDTKDTTFRFPLSPGLRMHLAHGGWSLFSRSEANIDPKNYPSE